MQVALVYDRINKWGGAESVLLALHELYPDAPLFTSVYSPETAPWAKDLDIRPSFLQKLPLPKTKHEYYPFLMGPAFETFNFDKFDLVISITHEFAKAIITKPGTKHICYCLTPTGYLWSGSAAYFASLNPILRTLTKPLVSYLRFYDKIVAHRPDHFIAISETVQARIKKYYGLDSSVVYPPATINKESLPSTTAGYYLIVSRLVPNKRIDIAVEAFTQLGWPLKIVGTGRELNNLKSLAGPTVEFLGYLTDSEVKKYYRDCKAFVLPGEEDFGLTAVEAQSYGKPVIAFNRGGATETVLEGKTGFFFAAQTSASLIETLKTKNLATIKPEACSRQAQKFSKENFKQVFTKVITD